MKLFRTLAAMALLLATGIMLLAGCKRVNEKETTESYLATYNLRYELNADKKTYSVAGIDGDQSLSKIVISPFYEKKKVTGIKAGAFENQKSLLRVVIPETITEIGERAFGGCDNLNNVSLWTVSDGVTYVQIDFVESEFHVEDVAGIGDISFKTTGSTENAANRIKASKFPGLSLKTIGKSAFEGCSALLAITIPDTVIEISDNAFRNCSRISVAEIPESVQTIGSGAFDGCDLLYCVSNKSSVGMSVGSTENGNIAKNAKVLVSKDGSCTYSSERNYQYVNKSFLFSGTAESGYTLHAFLPIDGQGDRSNLFQNLIDSTTGFIVSVGKSFLHSDLSAVLPENYKEEPYRLDHFSGASYVEFPDGVTEINENAFADATSLQGIKLPSQLKYIGKNAFRNCDRLGSVFIRVGVSAGLIISSAGIISSSAAIIVSNAFQSLVIPDSVETIAEGAFSGCKSLRNVKLGSGISFIEKGAFAGCDDLEQVQACFAVGWLRNGEPIADTSNEHMAELLKASDDAEFSNTVSKLVYKNINEKSGYPAFGFGENVSSEEDEKYTVSGMGSCRDEVVTVCGTCWGYEVVSIANWAFTGCETMKELYLPIEITQIGYGAFEETSLRLIVYAGTKADWEKIKIFNNSDEEAEGGWSYPQITVRCTDGDIN